MKLSVVTSVFLNYMVFDAVEAVANIGTEAIDLWCGRPHLYRHDYSHTDLTRLRQQLDDHGIHVESLMPAFFRYPHSLSSPIDAVRQDTISYVRDCIDTAVALGARTVLLVPGKSLHGQSADDAWQRMLDSIAQLCQYADPYDLWLGIEPANRFVSDLVTSSDDAMRIIGAINNPKLGAIMDTGHIHLMGESAEHAILNLGDRLLQFHINDNDGRRQQNQIPGEGNYDFHHFYAELQRYHYQGVLSLELGWEYTADPVPAVKESIHYMRELADRH